MDTIIAAIVGVVGSIIVALLGRSRRSVDDTATKFDPVVRMLTITNTGLGVTLITLIVVLSWGQLRDILQETEQTKNDVKEIQSRTTRTLADFPESRGDIEDPATKRNLDAQAILDGAGPKTMPASGRNWQTGDVVYVPKWEWVDLVQRDGLADNKTCLIKRFGRLKIKGFNQKRRAALVEYTVPRNTPDQPAGTACPTGALFFYPV